MQLSRVNLVHLVLVCLVIGEVYAAVTYRVVSKNPNGTKAEITIKDNTLYWTLILRFDNPVKLRVNTGQRIVSSSSEGRIYVIGGTPNGPGQSQTVVFEAKYDKKTSAKLIRYYRHDQLIS